jgi:hypothetical protein
LERLREENEALRQYKATSLPILADIALNPFVEMSSLRTNARLALGAARRSAAMADNSCNPPLKVAIPVRPRLMPQPA